MPKQRHEAVRTCVACRGEAGKQTMVRLVKLVAGTAAIDRTGRATGRGAYLHADPDCIAIARKRRAIERALNAVVGPEIWSELTPSS